MSYETGSYDNRHGDPVVVLVATGTHDVSRLVNLLAGDRNALCEHIALSERIRDQVQSHNGGRAALQLLAAHGGPDLLFPVAEEDSRHIIEFREDGWTIKHPLSCRPKLFDCPVNRAAEQDLKEPPAALGLFECSANDLSDRLLIGDRIEENHRHA